jgi:hypothetical protein
MTLQTTLHLSTFRILTTLVCMVSSTATLAQTPVELSFQQPICTQRLSGSVTLSAPAPAAGQVVQLTSNMPSLISVPPQVNVPPGATSAAINLLCTPAAQTMAVTLTATANNSIRTAVVNVPSAALDRVSLKPDQGPNVPTTSLSGAVALLAPAPVGGIIVTLSNSHPALVSIPASVTVAEGAKSAPFNIAVLSPVSRVANFTITATGLGVTKIVNGTLIPVELLSLSKEPPQKGMNVARVTLNGKAGTGGLMLQVSSDNKDGKTAVQPTMTIPQGENSALLFVQRGRDPVAITVTSGTVSKTVSYDGIK